jgi:hypothetical protein
VQVALLVGELEFHGHLALAVLREFPGPVQRVELEQGVFVHVRIHVDWVHGNNGRQDTRGSGDAADIVALGDERATHPAVDGGANLRVFEVEPGQIAGGLRREQARPGFAVARLPLVGLLGGNGLVLHQAGRAGGFPCGVVHADLRLLILGFALVELSLMPARIDHKQHVALLHQLAGLKLHLPDVPRNARTHFNHLDGLGAAGELIVFDQFLFLHGCDRDLRRRRGGGLRGRLFTAHGEQRQRRKHRGKDGVTTNEFQGTRFHEAAIIAVYCSVKYREKIRRRPACAGFAGVSLPATQTW